MNENDTRGNDNSGNDGEPQTDGEVSSCNLKADGEDQRGNGADTDIEDFIPDESENIFKAHSGNIR